MHYQLLQLAGWWAMPRERRQSWGTNAPAEQLTGRAYLPKWKNMHLGLSAFSSPFVDLTPICMKPKVAQNWFFWLHTPCGVQVTSDLNESCWQIRYSRICVYIYVYILGPRQLPPKEWYIRVDEESVWLFFFDRSTGTCVPSPGPCWNRWTATGHYLQVPTPRAPQTLQCSGGCEKESKRGVVYVSTQRDTIRLSSVATPYKNANKL